MSEHLRKEWYQQFCPRGCCYCVAGVNMCIIALPPSGFARTPPSQSLKLLPEPGKLSGDNNRPITWIPRYPQIPHRPSGRTQWWRTFPISCLLSFTASCTGCQLQEIWTNGRQAYSLLTAGQVKPLYIAKESVWRHPSQTGCCFLKWSIMVWVFFRWVDKSHSIVPGWEQGKFQWSSMSLIALPHTAWKTKNAETKGIATQNYAVWDGCCSVS